MFAPGITGSGDALFLTARSAVAVAVPAILLTNASGPPPEAGWIPLTTGKSGEEV
jgi:hypothetical protein